ncbi:MAG: DUF1361 domain-containing protein [Ferruginibacter sp.]
MKRSFYFNHLLYTFIGFIFIMIAVRFFYSGNRHALFLGWNIFLAWIPYAISNLFSANKKGWKQRFLFASWLLFWPNALYMVTDLIHINETYKVPLWYDALLFFSAAVAGLMMAFVSLYRVEIFIAQKLKKTKAFFLMIGILFMGSFGVYLGRFYRFNSWDIIHDPFYLAKSIFGQLLFPQDHLHTWAVTILFTIIFTLLYYIFKILPNLKKL